MPMNTPPPALPVDPSRSTPPEKLSLDARIEAVEVRLRARDDQVRERFSALVQRARRAAEPRRLVVPALGLVLALAGGWWLLRHGMASLRPQRPPSAVSGAGRRGPATDTMPWVRMLGFAWPLLPAAWRGKLNPATTSALMTVGLPMVERLMGARGRASGPPLRTALHVDLARYAGTWHEIARLPNRFESRCAGQPSATYTPRGETIEVINRCLTRQGTEKLAHGVARIEPDSGGAKLSVNFLPAWLHWLPFGWGDYWILFVDDAYSVAVVGNPSRDGLWILARERQLDAATLQALVDVAGEQGFAVNRLESASSAR
jgi:apolipoprotein D and lipocalin family protein